MSEVRRSRPVLGLVAALVPIALAGCGGSSSPQATRYPGGAGGLRTVLKHARKVRSYEVVEHETIATPQETQVTTQGAVYDLAARTFSEEITSPSGQSDLIQTPAAVYLGRPGTKWQEIAFPPGLVAPPAQPDAALTQLVQPGATVGTIGQLRPQGTTTFQVKGSLPQAASSSGTFVLQVTIGPTGLPGAETNTVTSKAAGKTSTLKTTRTYRSYNTSPKVAAPPPSDVSKVTHVTTLAQLSKLTAAFQG